MYRSALRSTPLRAIRPASQLISSSAPRRFASTTANNKRGTWKGTALRWGLAIAAVYYYNTSPLFADELPQPESAPAQFSDSDLPTIDALIEKKRKHVAASPSPPPPPAVETTNDIVEADIEKVAQEESDKEVVKTDGDAATLAVPEPGSPEALEQEASQQGAFNPETGEINWDCPCLGGMAHGPCGEEFKAAFSCFVYSKEEPKGMDCIDKFQHMQDCFRKYPEIYGSELADDEEDTAAAPEGAEVAEGAALAKTAELEAPTAAAPPAEKKEVKGPAVAEPIPKEAVDATDANKGKKQ